MYTLKVVAHEDMQNDDAIATTEPCASIERATEAECLAAFNATFDTNDYSVYFA